MGRCSLRHTRRRLDVPARHGRARTRRLGCAVGCRRRFRVWGGTVLWRRTGLPFATAAVFLATAVAALLAVLAIAGWPFPYLFHGWLAPVTALLFFAPGLLIVESRVHPRQWAQWKAYAEDKNAWDILLGRHVPYLRDTDSVDGPSSAPRR